MSETYHIGFRNHKTYEIDAWIKEIGERWCITPEQSEAYVFYRTPGIFLLRARMTASESSLRHTHTPQWVKTNEEVIDQLIL